MPQLNSQVTTNYNRVTAPYSRFGTRRLQAYQISVYGVSDADALYSDARWFSETYAEYVAASALLGITVETVDTHSQQVRWPSNSIHSAILKGAGDVAEIYYNGFFDEDHYDPDDNRIRITVLVAEDTFIDGEYADIFRSRRMIDAVFNQIQNFDWGDIDVYRVDLYGSSWYYSYDPSADDTSGPNALARLKSEPGSLQSNRESKAAVKARLNRR
jgi:hypothetical protein